MEWVALGGDAHGLSFRRRFFLSPAAVAPMAFACRKSVDRIQRCFRLVGRQPWSQPLNVIVRGAHALGSSPGERCSNRSRRFSLIGMDLWRSATPAELPVHSCARPWMRKFPLLRAASRRCCDSPLCSRPLTEIVGGQNGSLSSRLGGGRWKVDNQWSSGDDTDDGARRRGRWYRSFGHSILFSKYFVSSSGCRDTEHWRDEDEYCADDDSEENNCFVLHSLSLYRWGVNLLKRLFSDFLHAVRLVSRAGVLTLVSAPLPMLAAAAAAFPPAEDIAWSYLFWAIQRGGPCWIKFIQWASTRLDMFPSALCERCSRFHSRAPVHSLADTERRLSEALGHDWKSFLEIEPAPVGSGCIAQVHRGRLKKFTAVDWMETLPEGCQLAVDDYVNRRTIHELNIPVAVKIAHPHVGKTLKLDLEIMHMAAGLATWFSSWIPFNDIVHQFETLMKGQLNFVKEAENICIFRKNFRHVSAARHLARFRGRIVLPSVYFCSKAVLVESFENGATMGEWLQTLRSKRSSSLAAAVRCAADQAEDTALEHFSRGALNASAMANWPSAEECAMASSRTNGGRQYTAQFKNAFGNWGSDGYSLTDGESHSVSRGPCGPHLSTLRDNVGRFGLTAFMQMLFVDNFIHADLHPGNILIRFLRHDQIATDYNAEATRGSHVLNNTRKRGLKVLDSARRRSVELLSRIASKLGYEAEPDFEFVLLDCGLTTSLSPKDMRNFVDLFHSIVVNDGYRAGDLILTRARRQQCPDAHEFCSEVESIVKNHHTQSGGSMKLGQAMLSSVLASMLRVSVRYRVELDPEFVSIILSTMIIEGVGRQISPDLDLLRWAAPLLIKSAAFR